MAFASGVFTRLYNFVADAAASIPAQPARFDAELNGIATGLSTCLLRDGTQTVIANIPMSGYKFTGLGAATGTGQAVIYDQLTGYAPLASPAFTGTPTVPTATIGTNSTVAASTAYVLTAISGYAPLANPAFTGTPTAPTATAGTNSTVLATTAFVTSAVAAGTFSSAYTAPTRVLGNTYTNGATWRLVMATFNGAPVAGATILTPVVGGVTLPAGYISSGGSPYTGPMTFAVPPGATYSITASGNSPGSASIVTWVEI
jgi:hypothetical protein